MSLHILNTSGEGIWVVGFFVLAWLYFLGWVVGLLVNL